MESSIKDLIQYEMPSQHFDSIAVGVLDWASSFSSSSKQQYSFQCVEYQKQDGFHENCHLYFDLASLTKPLTLFGTYLYHPELFKSHNNKKNVLLLEHRAGLPSGGRLSKKDWKELLWSYPIREEGATTLYSDYSALRLMLELEKESGQKLEDLYLCEQNRGKLHFWKDLWRDEHITDFVTTGYRHGKSICGEVNDDNAYVIGEFCSHAGLFARIDDLCSFVLQMIDDGALTVLSSILSAKIESNDQGRFVLGFDRVQDLKMTLAGEEASLQTVGHLGFTGTSLWLDMEKKRGHIILTNATKYYYHDRVGLNRLRRKLGAEIWKLSRQH